MKKFNLLLLVLMTMMLFVSVVNAENISISSSQSVREVEESIFPQEVFYMLLMVGIAMLLIDIKFITEPIVPALPMIITSTFGFGLFLICAYLAPLTGTTSLVVSGAEAKYITLYVFSPTISYLMLGLSTVCFLMIWWGVFQLYRNFAEESKRIHDPDYQFEQYMKS
jgi:hypothetical protein